jgi:hypothetical protein
MMLQVRFLEFILQETFPPTDIFSNVELGDGRVWPKPDGVPAFVGDLPGKEQKLIWATQAVPVADMFNQAPSAR